LGNIDSFASSELNHCFKKSGRGDFFNTLSHKETLASPQQQPLFSAIVPDCSLEEGKMRWNGQAVAYAVQSNTVLKASRLMWQVVIVSIAERCLGQHLRLSLCSSPSNLNGFKVS
jgi:hypothetical protein